MNAARARVRARLRGLAAVVWALGLLALGATAAGPALAATISGTVFEDVAGDLLPAGQSPGGTTATNPDNPGLPSRLVRVYDSNLTLANTGTTNTTGVIGAYSITISPGTYYLAVSAPKTTAAGTGSVLMEQTYGSSGSGYTGAGGGTGHGALCVHGTLPTYTDQAGSDVRADQAVSRSSGACFGGRKGATADGTLGADNIATAEHVIRVVVESNTSNITGVDFGFSTRVVTNLNQSGQGSLRQFIDNANIIGGTVAKTMRFVPAVPTNMGTTGSTTAAWWRLALGGNVLPAASASAVIDGRAWSHQDGSTLLDYMSGNLEAAASVGAGSYLGSIPALARPELELNQSTGGSLSTVPVLTIGASPGAILRNLSLTGGSVGVLVGASNTSFTLEDSAIGWQPDGTPVRATNSLGTGNGIGVLLGGLGATSCTAVSGISGTVQRNAITGQAHAVANCATGVAANSLTYQYNVLGSTTAGPAFVLTPAAYQTQSALNVQNIRVLNNLITGAASGLRLFGPTGEAGGHLIEGNTITGHTGAGIEFVSSASGAMVGQTTVRGNAISGNGADGVSIFNTSANMRQIEITENTFTGNAGNAIDRNEDGVSTATGCPVPGFPTANGGLGRPVITSAARESTTSLLVSGTYCSTGTYRLEFYQATPGAGDGSGSAAAGEGSTYLGALTGLSGGSFSNMSFSFVSGVTLNVGAAITAIAIRTDGTTTAGNTSEFSANVVPSGSVIGKVFEDVAGDLLADGTAGGTNNPGIPGVTVRLYNASGGELASTVTDANGNYHVPSVGTGTFYVTVAAPTRTATSTAGGLQLEQTYASAGTGHDSASTAGGTTGYGTLCVAGTPPTYTDQDFAVSSNTAANPANGACYGGRRGGTADVDGTLNGSEHVVRVIVGDNAVTGVNFGFSARVVTHTNVSGQGSLRQFIANANAVGGTATKAMRFVPAVAANQSATAGSWWRINLNGTVNALPVINGSGTVLDGQARSLVDGNMVLDYVPGEAFSSRTVGTGSSAGTLPAVPIPELEISQNGGVSLAADSAPVLSVGTSDGVQIKNLSITGGTNGVLVAQNNVTNLLIEGNTIGRRPSGVLSRASSSTSGAGGGVQFGSVAGSACTAVSGIRATVRGNSITGAAQGALNCVTGLAVDDLVYQGNTFHEVSGGNGLVLSPFQSAAVATQNLVLRNNSFVAAAFYGLRLFTPPGTGSGHQIVGNEFTDNRGSAISFANGTGSVGNTTSGAMLVQGNTLDASSNVVGTGAGVQIDSAASLQRIQITQNRFGSNAGPAIDLNGNGISTGTDCAADTSGQANGNLGRPVLNTVRRVGATSLSVTGTLCDNDGTYTLEFYRTASGVASYLGRLEGLSTSSFTAQTVTTSESVATGDVISAIAIRTDAGSFQGNTSEFSATTTVQPMGIAGVVFEDVAGNLLASDTETVGDSNNPGIPGVTVRLFRTASSTEPATSTTQVASATTGADGSYAFSNLEPGTYYVAVQAPTRTAGSTAVGLLLEQTYATAGTGNSATGAIPDTVSFGSLCVAGTAPNYTDRGAQTIINGSSVRSNGACYGGRRGATADTPSSTPALDDLEHVVRVVLAADSVTGAHFGFSARVVTNVNTTGQGSVRQFITNASALGGSETKTMRFVPTVVTNMGSSGAAWWQVALGGTALPEITASDTVLDGRAWNYVLPTSQLSVYAGNLESTQSVGTGGGFQATIGPVARPALELTQPNAGTSDDLLPVLSVAASRVQILNLSITGGTNGVRVGSSNLSGLRIVGNAIGMRPDGSAWRPTAGTSLGSAVQFGRVTSSTCTAVSGITSTVVSNNTLTGGTHVAVNCVTGLAVDDLVYEGNFMRGHTSSGSAVVLSPHSGNAVGTQSLKLRNNLITGANFGLRLFVPSGTGATSGGQQVIGNTFSANRASAVSFASGTGGSAMAGESLVQGNVFTGAGDASGTGTGAGVRIDSGAALQRVRITQNSFSGNAGPAIDLNANGVSTGTGCAGAGGNANGNLGRPVITSAVLASATQLNVSASFCGTGTYTLEFYKVASGTAAGDTGGDGLVAGEGVTYLGAVTGRTGGNFSGQTIAVTSGAVSSGDSITAIAIRTDIGASEGNTSEFSANYVLSSALTLRATTTGGTGSFAFTVSNADTDLTSAGSNESAATLVVPTAGVATAFDADTTAAGTQPIRLVAAGTDVVVTHAVLAGRIVTAASCTNGSSTFSASGLPAYATGSASVTILGTSITAGSAWTCDFALTVGAPPQVTLRVVTAGGTGSLEFTGSNGLPTASPGVVVTTTAAGVAADSAAQVLTTSHAATTVTQLAATGWALSSAVCFDRNAAVTGNPAQFGSVSGATLTIAAANLPLNADVVCTFSNTASATRISGRVFRDSGTGGGTANDGLQNGGETGLAGVTLRLTNCASTVHASTTSDGNGDYSLPVGSATGTVCVEQGRLTGHLSTGANVAGTVAVSGAPVAVSGTTFTYSQTSDRFQFTLAAGVSHAGLNFGDVPPNRLHTDGARTALPGTMVQYTHQFVAASSGTVTFGVVAVQTPANAGWAQTLYRDTNCSADLDAADTALALSTPISVTEGQTLCLVVVQAVPHGVAAGAASQITLSAVFAYTSANPALSATLSRADMTTVSLSTLELAKRVRNVTQGAATFAVSNQARSGDELEYQVTYRNNGASPIGTLVVRDSTPAYSTFVSATCGTPLPAGVSACVVTSSPGSGGTGAIVWTFTGTLGGGLQGLVVFRVRVD